VRILHAIAVAALLVPALAAAQLFKCKGPDGKIVYSDTRCEASSKGTLKVTPMGTTPSEKELADAAAKAEAAKAGAPGAVPATPGAAATGSFVNGRYQMSSSDKDRIRDLEVGNTRMGAYDEQKSASSLTFHRRGFQSSLIVVVREHNGGRETYAEQHRACTN